MLTWLKALLGRKEMDMDTAYKRLEFHEGFRAKKYMCSEGRWTIGIGHNLEAREFTPEEKKALGDWENGITHNGALMLLRNDVENCLKDLKQFPFWKELDDDRQYALLDMCFQLGFKGLKKFKSMLKAFENGDFVTASKECLNSKYRKQTPTRAKRIAVLIRYKKWVEYSKDLEKIEI
jgi:lysozyme